MNAGPGFFNWEGGDKASPEAFQHPVGGDKGDGLHELGFLRCARDKQRVPPKWCAFPRDATRRPSRCMVLLFGVATPFIRMVVHGLTGSGGVATERGSPS